MLLISHDVTGSGPAVLLIHAGVADRRICDPQLPDPGRGHRVVRVDLRGCGDSPLPPNPYAHVTDITTLLGDIGVDRTAMVGASFKHLREGGLILGYRLKWALQVPLRSCSVSWLGGAAPSSRGAKSAVFARS